MPTIKRRVQRPWLPERKPQEGRFNANQSFYASTVWRKVRALKIKQSPICEECAARGVATPARVVDHVRPINEGGEPLALDNLQSLCYTCHNQKSGREAHAKR